VPVVVFENGGHTRELKRVFPAKAQRRKEECKRESEIFAFFFAPLRLCGRKLLFTNRPHDGLRGLLAQRRDDVFTG
jgi:hypothetical protein